MHNVIDVHTLKNLIESKNDNIILIAILENTNETLIPNSYIVWRPDYMGENPSESVSGEVLGFRKPKKDIEILLSKCGATENSEIIIYSYNSMHDCARFWWQVKLLGHKDVKYVDGGLNAWIKSNYPISKGVPLSTEPIKTNYKARCYETKKMNVNIEQVIKALEDETWIIIDTRSEDEYLGKLTTSSKSAFGTGRIKGSVHIEWINAIDLNTNMLKSTLELESIYEKIKDKKIITLCQSGVRSAHTYFVLKNVLGLKNIYNYDGSWIEWSYVASVKSRGVIADELRNNVISLTEEWKDNKEII